MKTLVRGEGSSDLSHVPQPTSVLPVSIPVLCRLLSDVGGLQGLKGPQDSTGYVKSRVSSLRLALRTVKQTVFIG